MDLYPPNLNARPLPNQQSAPPTNVISLQDLIMLRINLDQCPTKTADLNQSLAHLDNIILTHISAFTITPIPGAPKP